MTTVKSSKLKVQNCSSKSKIIFWLSLGLTLPFTLLTFNQSYVLAQSPSSESTPTASENLNEKIKDIREAVKEKVQEKIDTVQRGQKRAFVGKVDEIANSTLIMTDREGKKQAKVDEEAKIISEARKEIKLEDLEVGSWVIAMGYLEETDLLNTLRIVAVEEPKPITREVAFGKVTDISEEDVLTIKNKRRELTYTIATNSKTKITQRANGKTEEVEFTSIQLDDRVVAVGTPSENEEKIITAKIIYVIPASPTEKSVAEESTPSPTPEDKETKE